MNKNPYSSPPKQFPAHPQVPQQLPQGMAVAALVCGLLSLLGCGCATGIPAVICGYVGMKQADRGEAGGKGLAVAGLIMGILSLVITIGIGLLYAGLIFFAVAAETM
ncbi:MAG: DUF4190 domain-containing protein [Planctomycetota bacterium]|nr:DUF4190 domain-containing protein [Planctomycetota bacterium]MEC7499742.1 DUF4190 domain-containing protein [Planctomycetota bacterium]MEC7719110.1 DUF4190 domain-containing protein [Planctomycetota bacterium]MEC8389124.1 DUF4190 domain-containing protein [Planctomycetota bacterium]MEC8781444.1 DUF4190 domain-containing protein [Planctomycetota bacterium]